MSNFTKSIFWALYIISVMIELTYLAGKYSAPYIIQATAFTLTCFTYVKDFSVKVWNNRELIRNTIGNQFVYEVQI